MIDNPFRLRGDVLAGYGNAVAVASRTGALTYTELARQAASVWRSLQRVGVLPGHRVGLLSSGRAMDEPVGLVGILTSGAVAVPLDATAPAKHLAKIMVARGCRAIVADEQARSLIDAIAAEVGVDNAPARVDVDAQGGVSSFTRSRGTVADEVDPCYGVACILHTSGSTGDPKPVPITWNGLDAFTGWGIELIGLGSQDRVLRVAELIFDLSWFDHIATFRAGATLVTMGRRDLASGRALRDAIDNLRPTVIYGVPSMLMKLASALPADTASCPDVRTIFFAGEVYPPRELLTLAERVPGARLFNLYGPTETNVCTYHEVDRACLDGRSELAIGIACPYATCYLVAEDGRGRVVDGPGTGELVVQGPTTVGGGPYATRDRVERQADGLFYFRGRIDRMVKIRGYRVEPGQVEAHLAAHPAVRQAAVFAYEDVRLGKVLRAAVELTEGDTGTDERVLRMFLAERLPSYMVPEKVRVVRELPRTATGKIDYQALARE